MAGDIVPIELELTEGSTYTLWAPRWREGDDEWEAFLGLGEDLYGFEGVAELVAFVRSGAGNDLDDHPAWRSQAGLKAEKFVPEPEHSYDLISVPELAAEDPSPEVIAELEENLEIVRIIGEVCELITVTKFFNGNPILSAVTIGTTNFVGRDGAELWAKVGETIAAKWDAVIDALEEVVTTPDVDEKGTKKASDELAVAAEAAEKAAAEAAEAAEAAALAEAQAAADEDLTDSDDDPEDDDLDSSDDDDDDVDEDDEEQDDEAQDDDEQDDDEQDEEEEVTFWGSVGIDPIKITTTDRRTFFTLRYYLDDSPIFLGKNGSINVFRTESELARYLADDHDTELSELSTYEEIHAAASEHALEIEVEDENVYDLLGISEDISDGPRRINKRQLDLACELLLDAADFADDDSVQEALGVTTPLGFFVSYALDPKPTRMAPSGPFDNEAAAWSALDHEFAKRLKKP